MRHKRGDTFDYVAILPASIPDGYYLGRIPTCQIRDMRGKKIADVVTEWVDPVTTRSVGLHVADTQAWPIGSAVFDVQFLRESDGDIRSTLTIQFLIIEDVTRP